jgi:hypothetical protein
MEPGWAPPMSAWWPRDAVKKIISCFPASGTGPSFWLPADEVEVDELLEEEDEAKTGVMTVRSGRCDPPATGELARSTSPGFKDGPRRSSWYLIANDMDPKWTGMKGALA